MSTFYTKENSYAIKGSLALLLQFCDCLFNALFILSCFWISPHYKYLEGKYSAAKLYVLFTSHYNTAKKIRCEGEKYTIYLHWRFMVCQNITAFLTYCMCLDFTWRLAMYRRWLHIIHKNLQIHNNVNVHYIHTYIRYICTACKKNVLRKIKDVKIKSSP